MTDLEMTRQFGDANTKHAGTLANIARAEEGDVRREAMYLSMQRPMELGYSRPYSGL